MFTTANNRFNKRPRVKQCYRLGSLLSVLPADKLLATKEVHVLIQEIQALSQLPPAYFTVLYQKTINNFAEMVQLLPFEEDGILAGLLHRGIVRAALALRHYTAQVGDEQDPLVTYAIFSAALLSDLGKLLTRYTIVISAKDNSEDSIEWQPFVGSMLGHGDHYKIFPQASSQLDLEHEVTALLARQLLPEEGFLWLSSDAILFKDWLLGLRGASGVDVGRICLILSLIKLEDLQELLASLSQPLFEIHADSSTEHADQFYSWLRDGIDSGVLKLNTNGGVFLFEGEFLVSTEIFQHFIGERRLQVSVEQLRSQVEKFFKCFIRADLTNKENVVKRSSTSSDHVKLHTTVNKSATMGFLNNKNLIVNAIRVRANLLLKKNMTLQAVVTHGLPKLNVDKNTAVAAARQNLVK